MEIKDTLLAATLLTQEGVKLLGYRIQENIIYWKLGGIPETELKQLLDAAFKPGFMVDRLQYNEIHNHLKDILNKEGFITKHQYEGGRYAKVRQQGGKESADNG